MDGNEFHYNYNYFDDWEEDVHLNAAEQHRRRVVHQVGDRIHLRDARDPFACSVDLFMGRYRIPQHLVLELAEILNPYAARRVSERAIPLPIKILCALGFYASGSYQKIVSSMADISLGQATVSNCIEEVTTLFNHVNIMRRFIHFPENHQERELVIERNARLGMPRVLGFIDGTYVQIFPPTFEEYREAYYCRKGYTAINVLVVSDADLNILTVNAQYPGSCNDPYIYRTSGVREEMIRAYRESRCWLLGDSAYPEEPWLHVPLPNALPGTPEFVYTRLHCSCRNSAERLNGVWKGRWRCLLSDRVLHYNPVKAGRIINACAVLHNFCQEWRVPNRRVIHVNDGADVEGWVDEEENFENNAEMRRLAQEELQFLIQHANA